MIELIGFWTNVTAITTLIIALPVFITVWFFSMVIAQITEDKYKGKKFFEWFLYDDCHEKFRIFNKFIVSEGYVYVTLALSLIANVAFLLSGIITGLENNVMNFSSNIVENVAQVSSCGLQHFSGWLTVVVVVYFLSILVLRRLYKMYVRLDEALKKLNNE